jgi:hypothetical protein
MQPCIHDPCESVNLLVRTWWRRCRAIKRSNCFHSRGHGADCEASNTTNMIIFAGIQILLSQLPNFHKLWWLSIVAAVMSLAYSSIGLGLSIAKIAGKLMHGSYCTYVLSLILSRDF